MIKVTVRWKIFRLSMAKMFIVGSPLATATLAAYGGNSTVACGVLWESGPWMVDTRGAMKWSDYYSCQIR